MKKLINDPAGVVEQYVRGLALAHPHLLRASTAPLYVTRARAAGEVAVVSGGGSGHEPLHCGLVGPGMLHAAVPGPVFTSPPAGPVFAAARAAHMGRGVVLVVKNYTGDVLNFETAAELLELDGIEVRTVLVADDVAVEDSTFTAGRRGVAGTLFVEKVAGAAAAGGGNLAAVARIAERAARSVRTMGVALEAGRRETTGRRTFDLADGEIEIGVGIHGEPGRERTGVLGADETVDRLLDPILADLSLAPAERVLLFVNGMGATTSAELYICFARAHERLTALGVDVARTLVGTFVTSLDMAGISISVARLDDELLAAWDAPCTTPALTRGPTQSGTMET